MIRYTKFVKYHGEIVSLRRIHLKYARFLYKLGHDIYIVEDLTEFDKKNDLRLFFCANKNQGVKDFDTVCKIFRSRNRRKVGKTLLYFILE